MTAHQHNILVALSAALLALLLAWRANGSGAPIAVALPVQMPDGDSKILPLRDLTKKRA